MTGMRGTKGSARGRLLLAAGVLAAVCACVEVRKVRWTPGFIVSGATPACGAIQGGTAVTIHGFAFEKGAVVYFGDRLAPVATVESANRIVCVSPPGAQPGEVRLEVVLPGGPSERTVFTYLSWAEPACPRRMPVPVSGIAGESVAEYTVRVVLPYREGMAPDFSGVRFSAEAGGDENAVPFWLETASPNEEAVFWVRVPSIPAAPGGATLYAYFGNAAAPGTPDFDATFSKLEPDPDCLALWHLDEGAGSTALDATSNGNDADLYNMISPWGWQAADGGRWGTRPGIGFSTGSYLEMDGVDDRAAIPNYAPGLLGTFSVEAWVRPDTPSAGGAGRYPVSRWQTRADPSAGWEVHAPASARGGCIGGVFDGRYVYYAPYRDAVGYSGEVARYDTHGPFEDDASWAVFDATSLDADLVGFGGATFDGSYVYFLPLAKTRMLRYDPSAPFTSGSSWTVFTPADRGIGAYPFGYMGAVFDGRFLYFAPNENLTGYHGEVLRYDTEGAFSTDASWRAFNPDRMGVAAAAGEAARGFAGALFDGRYVYFIPYTLSSLGAFHGTVLRYDTHRAFDSIASWSCFDPGSQGVGFDPDGYAGGSFDGRYLYFTPYFNGDSFHREVLRYDTHGSFREASAWSTFEPPQGAEAFGYFGAAFDGHYVLFIPNFNGAMPHSKMMRYNTFNDFDAPGAWSVIDPEGSYPSFSLDGFRGAVYDGRYVYLSPAEHNEFVRYDAGGVESGFKLCASRTGSEGGLGGGPFGCSAVLGTTEGTFSVAANRAVAPGAWHHLAFVYDGSSLVLYLDGAVADTRPAYGDVPDVGAPLKFGNMYYGAVRFAGGIDETAIWSKALSAEEVRAHVERRRAASSPPTVGPVGAVQKR